MQVRDGDPRLRPFYNRHYSARKSKQGKTCAKTSPFIVGPGEKLVLLTPLLDALWVWRRTLPEFSKRPEAGVNCAVFRREPSAVRASDLILAAEPFALERWPDRPLRLFTYVDPSKIASGNPGYCFKVAGYRRCGRTLGGHGRQPLDVLEKFI